jgi:putative spermidine/putrescine transport system substrate-binding protein
MKRIVRQSTLAVAAVALIGFANAASAESITVVSWGGAYTKSQVEAYHKPFTEMTGVEVVSADYNGGLAEVKAQVEAGNVTWDLIDLELADAVRGCDEGLLEPLDLAMLPPAPDGTPAEEDFLPGTLIDCAVATIVWTTIYAYDGTKYPDNPPSTIADLFDLEKYPGKRALRKAPKINLEWALLADGVPRDEVYEMLSTPEGQDRAFAKLDTIKDHVIWWESGAQPPQLLADGEVVMASAYNGRLFNAAVAENKPFVIVWDGHVWDIDLWGMLKGAPNQDRALEFIKFSTDTQRLADQASWISYGPARQSSIALVGKHATAGVEMAPHMPTAPDNFKNALQNDYEFWADFADELNEKFNVWLAQ